MKDVLINGMEVEGGNYPKVFQNVNHRIGISLEIEKKKFN